jgi:hypothetical protein
MHMGTFEGWGEQGLKSVRWRLAALGAVAMACLVLAAGCGSSSPPNNAQPTSNPGVTAGPTGSPIDDQGVYVASVLRDRDSLFAGFLVTPKGLKFRKAETTSFEVVVCGVDSNRKACADNLAAALAEPSASATTIAPGGTPTVGSTPSATLTSPAPTTSNPRPSASPTVTSTSNTNTVQIGGQVLVTATGSPTLTIQPLSQPVQPVLLKTESASWSFNVIPSVLGDFTLAVHISVLRGASGPLLLPEQTVNIPVQVFQTGGDRIVSGASSFWKIVQQVAAVLGAAGISLGAVVTFLVRRVRRRRRVAAAAVPAGVPSPPPYPGASGYPATPSPSYPAPPSPASPPVWAPPPAPRPQQPPGGYAQQPTPYLPIQTPPPLPPEPPTRHLDIPPQG